MLRGWIPTTLAAAVLLALAAAATTGCGAKRAKLRAAKTSGYQADFAIVYSETLAAVTELYPYLRENAAAGVINTHWHPLRMQSGQEGEDPGVAVDPITGLPASTSPLGAQARIERTRYFIRFDVYVVGGNPWRVRVDGQASKWQVGDAVPVEMKGGDEPHWLQGRVDALQLAIYDRLKQHAVPLKVQGPPPEPEKPQRDLARYGDIPAEVAEVIGEVEDAARQHDIATLRRHMRRDFTWSFGAAGDADLAITMWKADSEVMRQLAAILASGCRVDANDAGLVVCPVAYAEQPNYLGYRAGFARDGDRWQMIFFVTGD